MNRIRHIILVIIILVISAISGIYLILEWPHRSSTIPTQTPKIIPTTHSTTPLPSPSTSSFLQPSPPPTLNTLLVPFTPQAPFGQWLDPIYQNGCEEASILMVMYWIQNKTISPQEATTAIADISNFEQKKYGESRDSSATDTAQLIKDYFNYQNISVSKVLNVEEMISQISAGNILVVPVNGQKLGNPYFTPPGPIEHMLVIKWYDPKTKEFITNDPGTKHGENYRYASSVMFNALQDYPTGFHLPLVSGDKKMIIIKPSL